MIAAIADIARLARAGIVLSRRDALIPKELEPHLPRWLRWIGAMTRFGAPPSGDRLGVRMAAAFERLGPAYVKLGQFMATRPDIVGFELASDLGRLQDKMPPFSDTEARAQIKAAFGKSADELFTQFSGPIAAASIAQVHKAKLHSGEFVAVKILRPDIERKANLEFRAFNRAAHIIEFLVPAARRMEPVKFVGTLRNAAAIELDLRLEAGAASELQELMEGFEGVRTPEVIWSLTARRVLTLAWVDGTPLGDIAALDARGIDREAMARLVIAAFLTQALHHGFFHADMHQGNIIVDQDGALVLIDFGIMGRLDEATRTAFAEIIYGFITRNYRRIAEVHFDAGYISDKHSVETFAQSLRAVGEPLQGRNAAQVDMSRVLQQLFDVTDLFDMHLRPELVLLQRTMVTVEGVARLLDPKIDMWRAATPTVRSYVDRAIGPGAQARKLQGATQKALALAPRLPDYVERLATAADRLNSVESDTVSLAKQHNEAMVESRRMRRLTGLVAIAAVLLAAIALFR